MQLLIFFNYLSLQLTIGSYTVNFTTLHKNLRAEISCVDIFVVYFPGNLIID